MARTGEHCKSEVRVAGTPMYSEPSQVVTSWQLTAWPGCALNVFPSSQGRQPRSVEAVGALLSS